jgi:type IV fimbrial biogenesis protein FimT
LIEQVMVLAIMAVLVTIAAPSMHRMLGRSRLQSAQIDLIAGLRQARYSAVSHGVITLFCPSPDGLRCADSSHWESGWLTAADRDGDKQPDHAVIYTGSAPPGVRVLSSNGRHRVRFHPDGSARGTNLTFTLCLPGQHTEVLTVVVSNPGRVMGGVASKDDAARCEAGA